jgi:riboflavin transporter FmnP
MRAVGIVATGMLSAVALGLVYLGLRSLPDIRRYLKLSRM